MGKGEDYCITACANKSCQWNEMNVKGADRFPVFMLGQRRCEGYEKPKEKKEASNTDYQKEEKKRGRKPKAQSGKTRTVRGKRKEGKSH